MQSSPESTRLDPRSGESAAPGLSERAFSAMAHHLRSRLLATLRLAGPATATSLARTLGTNSGATSYHLRRLHEAGLIEDTHKGAGRRRVWRAVPIPAGWQVRAVTDAPGAAAAWDWVEHDVVRHIAEQSADWLDRSRDWPPSWREATRTSDGLVLVTAEQLDRLRDDLAHVVAKYRRVGQGNPQAKRVAVYSLAVPLDRSSDSGG